MNDFLVAALYLFTPLDDYEDMRDPLKAFCVKNDVRGSLLLAGEGINGTICGPETGVRAVLDHLRADPRLTALTHKEAWTHRHVFKRMKVRLKQEIVRLAVDGIDPNEIVGEYVKPEDWNALIKSEDVAVIDSNGALIALTEEVAPIAGAEDKAQILRKRVERLLEARVGVGNAIVEVSVDTETETEEIRERRFDPEARVIISTDTEERSSNSNEAGSGDVTVASNLPDGDGAGGDSASSQNSETRERINYEVSETERAVTRSAGAVKRISVAVLVNQMSGPTGETPAELTERSPEEIEALRELVASAVGYDESRGDIITIKSMELQSIVPLGTEAQTSLLDLFEVDVMSAIQMAILAIVALVRGLFVVRPILARQTPVPALPADPPAIAARTETPSQTPALTGEVSDLPDDFPDIALNGNTDDFGDLPAMNFAPVSDIPVAFAADPVDLLLSMIVERQDETVEILRTWLEDSEEKA